LMIDDWWLVIGDWLMIDDDDDDDNDDDWWLMIDDWRLMIDDDGDDDDDDDDDDWWLMIDDWWLWLWTWLPYTPVLAMKQHGSFGKTGIILGRDAPDSGRQITTAALAHEPWFQAAFGGLYDHATWPTWHILTFLFFSH
jgi:hypothetical protein